MWYIAEAYKSNVGGYHKLPLFPLFLAFRKKWSNYHAKIWQLSFTKKAGFPQGSFVMN